MKKKIMFFDWWEKGCHHFVPLHARLRALDYECVLVHCGAWYNAAIEHEQVIDGILCREVGYYGGKLRRALDAERPDIVFVLNCGATVDRMVNRLCRSRKIPTIYLMHGIKAIGSDLDEFIRHQDAHWSLRRRLKKLPKYAGIIISYLDAIARDRPIALGFPGTYKHFIQLALSPGAARERPWPHEDVYCDRALVYANVYRDSLISEASYPANRVRVVGNPNLDAAVLVTSDTNLQAAARAQLARIGVREGRRAVVYMEDAFVEQGIGAWTEATRIAELREIAHATAEADCDLIIKMHPGSDPAAAVQAFQNNPEVRVVTRADIAQLVWACDATIGHISTTLMLPVVLDRPLVVPTWSAGLENFGYYVKSGAAIPVASAQELTSVLRDPRAAREARIRSLRRFLDDFVTYTDGHSWERIVRQIEECVHERTLLRFI